MTTASLYRPCTDCGRLINADADMHRRCQKCRGGGRWPTGKTAQWQREYRARLRAAR